MLEVKHYQPLLLGLAISAILGALSCLVEPVAIAQPPIPPQHQKAQPEKARYQLLQRKIGTNKVLIWLKDWKTGHILWKRRCENLNTPIAWSHDHSALMIWFADLYPSPYGGEYRILYWRAGHRPRLVRYPGLFSDFDDLANVQWSPDDSRFAFLGGSTAFESGGPIIGALCCVDAVTGHFFFGMNTVGYYQWAGATQIRYIPLGTVYSQRTKYDEFVPQHPRYWTGRITDKMWEDPAWLEGKANLHGKRWPW